MVAGEGTEGCGHCTDEEKEGEEERTASKDQVLDLHVPGIASDVVKVVEGLVDREGKDCCVDATKRREGQERYEPSQVQCTDTVVDPRTVVIVSCHTESTDRTVL